MKQYLISSLCMVVLMCSCNKNEVLPSNDSEANKLASKYNLVLDKLTNAKNTTKNFNTLAELDSYLSKRDSLLKVSKVKIDNKTYRSTVPISTQSANGSSGGYGYASSEIPGLDPYNQVLYNYKVKFPSLEGQGFPGDVEIGIDYGNMFSVSYFSLLYSGGTFGTYSYNNQGMYMNGFTATVQGVYTETYGVAGLYNYYANYGVDFRGTTQGMGTSMTCTLQYVKF